MAARLFRRANKSIPPRKHQLHETIFELRSKGRPLKSTSKSTDLDRLRTEQTNSAATDLDRKSSLEIARLINQEDASVAAAVKRALPQIARAIDQIPAALRKGGRPLYFR